MFNYSSQQINHSVSVKTDRKLLLIILIMWHWLSCLSTSFYIVYFQSFLIQMFLYAMMPVYLASPASSPALFPSTFRTVTTDTCDNFTSYGTWSTLSQKQYMLSLLGTATSGTMQFQWSCGSSDPRQPWKHTYLQVQWS